MRTRRGLRRLVPTVAMSVMVAPVLVALPVMSLPSTARPHPVAPSLSHVGLGGVDAQALAEADASAPAGQAGPAGAAASSPAGTRRPAVLTQRLRAAAFQTLGVTWDAADARSQVTRVQVRWHTRADGAARPWAQGWSGWTDVEVDPDGDGTAAAGTVRPGTDPLWTGPADGVQVRVDTAAGATPAGLRLDLVDPGSSDYDAHVGDVPAAAAQAVTTRPTIYSRATWGADESKRRGSPTYMTALQAGVLHHTAGINGYSREQVPSIIRGDYAYHLSRGWTDIGYNFLVDRFGRIWEGRAGGIDKAVKGAHAGGFNQNTVGVSVLGNYESAAANDAIVDAVARIFAWRLELYHRDPLGTTRLVSEGGGTSRYDAGVAVVKPVIMGHRDVGLTACPGKNLYPQLARIRQEAAAFMRTSFADPALARTTAALGQGSSLTVTALRATDWRLEVTRLCLNTPAGGVSGRTTGRWRFVATWPGRVGSVVQRAGLYRMTLTGNSVAGPARPVAATVTVPPPAPPPMPVQSSASATGGYVPLPPSRVLNTVAGPVQPLGPGGRADLQIAGRAGVPASGASAVALTVTTLCPTVGGFLSVVPTGWTGGWSGTSSHVAGMLRSTTVLVPLSSAGQVSVRNSGGISDVVVDVVGYVAATATTRTLVPDTASLVGGGALTIAAGATRTFALPSVAGATAARVTTAWLDIHTAASATGGLVLGTPAGGTAATQAISYPVGEDDRLVLAPVHAGQLVLKNIGPAAVTVYAGVTAVQSAAPPAGGTLTVVVDPWRMVDKIVLGPSGATFDATPPSGVVPSGARAVIAVVTGLSPAERTRVGVTPVGVPWGPMAVVDVPAGAVGSNLAVLPLAGDGRVSLRAGHPMVTVVDVVGYVR